MPFIYYDVSDVSSMLLRPAEPRPSGLKKLDTIPCLMWMKNLVVIC
jgi:hypothetical protein